MSDYLIGIDAGTSVIKSVLFDQAGNEIARVAARSYVSRPQSGWAEQDMNALFSSVVDTLSQLVAEHPSECRRVAAIGVSAQGDGTWLIDAKGEPVRPAILWLDARCAPIISRWKRDGTADTLFALTGTEPCVSLQNAQLRWILENDPETFDRTHAVMHAGDWIFFCLTGESTSELSQVGHTYFDRAQESFSHRALAAAGIDAWHDRIPPLRDAFATPGTLRADVAERTGLMPGTPIIGPLFDVCATSLGMGAIHDGDVCTILGSAGIHQMILREPSHEPANVGYNIVMGPPNRWVRMLSSMTGTLNLDWFLEEIGLTSPPDHATTLFESVEALVSQTAAGAGGLIYLPFIDPAGERAPFVHAGARASWFGLHAGLGRNHMLRALYEGVAFAARDCYEHMPKPFASVRIAGGGSKSPTWLQILADVTEKSIERLTTEESGALGAALMAGTVSGMYASIEEAIEIAVRPARPIEPRPQVAARYNALYERYKALLQAVLPLWDEPPADPVA